MDKETPFAQEQGFMTTNDGKQINQKNMNQIYDMLHKLAMNQEGNQNGPVIIKQDSITYNQKHPSQEKKSQQAQKMQQRFNNVTGNQVGNNQGPEQGRTLTKNLAKVKLNKIYDGRL